MAQCPHLNECKQRITEEDYTLCTVRLAEWDFDACFENNDMENRVQYRRFPEKWEEIEEELSANKLSQSSIFQVEKLKAHKIPTQQEIEERFRQEFKTA